MYKYHSNYCNNKLERYTDPNADIIKDFKIIFSSYYLYLWELTTARVGYG
ncbi:hypothetical protein PPEP_a2439 [Pseudoalteromonas peptidolytica F12-50-A1]|uniref:Uncharacterized protein n=1 Tax=Pseudoalteromonas peptidolytica F12-50-A1 TaxID=1315280 RepID=A0A8I0MS50_9GAMM|nr:hypothetical protein [Pseudoalteromonas peptidolytica F12-50-A1]